MDRMEYFLKMCQHVLNVSLREVQLPTEGIVWRAKGDYFPETLPLALLTLVTSFVVTCQRFTTHS